MDRWMPWVMRLTWVATAVAGAEAVAAAVDDRSEAVRTVATWGAAAGWVAGVVAMAIPAVVSLTATRVIVPVAIVAAVAAILGGAPAFPTALFVALSVAATLVAQTAEVGRSFVQASAYGDESRFALRPPVGFAIAAVTAWCVWAVALVVGPLLLAVRSWVAGVALTAVAIVGAWPLFRRWHLLSRRWLVLVPAGLVVHDPVVLGETVMLRRDHVAHIGLAPAGTDALDLTGPAAGHALEVRTRHTETVLLAPDRDHPTGRAFHVHAFLVAPSRPGRALADAATRSLPVR